MLEKRECLKARSKIQVFSILKDNSLALATELHGIKIISLGSCESLQNISPELLSYSTTAYCFSYDSALFAFANGSVIYVIDTHTKLPIQTIKTAEGEITLLSFVPNSKYLVTGTKNGRVMQYRYDGRSHLSRLCSFGKNSTSASARVKNNYVSAFAFYENLFAVSGYGGVITILRMHSYTHRYNINASKVRINTLLFLDKRRLVSGSSDGIVKIHSLKKYSQAKSVTTPFSEIRQILLMPNPDYILVSAKSEKLVLINITTAKVVNTSYLHFDAEVTHMQLSRDKQLLVALVSKKVITVELPTTQHLKSFILHNSLDKAYELIQMDPTLQGTREHKRVEVMFEKQYAKAIEALINADTKEAKKLLKNFNDIESKQESIRAIFKAFELYPRFQSLYADKKYALAYAMAEKHPALKYTKQYRKMEEGFKEVFAYAQKQILLGRSDVAKEILSPYATAISKRAILNLVLKENETFIKFLKATAEKDYTLTHELVLKNELFSQIPSYITLQNELEKKLHHIRRLINNLKIEESIEAIKELLNIPSLKEELQNLYRDAKAARTLQEAYSRDDFKTCYEILDGEANLEEIELTKLLEKHWSKLMNKGEEFALQGDFKSIKQLFKELLFVKTRIEKIGDLIRLSFQTRIKALLAKRKFPAAESIIYTYLDTFGVDSEIIHLQKVYENYARKKLALMPKREIPLSRNSWIESPIIASSE